MAPHSTVLRPVPARPCLLKVQRVAAPAFTDIVEEPRPLASPARLFCPASSPSTGASSTLPWPATPTRCRMLVSEQPLLLATSSHPSHSAFQCSRLSRSTSPYFSPSSTPWAPAATRQGFLSECARKCFPLLTCLSRDNAGSQGLRRADELAFFFRTLCSIGGSLMISCGGASSVPLTSPTPAPSPQSALKAALCPKTPATSPACEQRSRALTFAWSSTSVSSCQSRHSRGVASLPLLPSPSSWLHPPCTLALPSPSRDDTLLGALPHTPLSLRGLAHNFPTTPYRQGAPAGLGQLREALPDGFVPGGALFVYQVRWKKKRGKKEKVTLSAEQQATKVW